MKIIAEIGSVHDGSFGNACKLIEAAAECGADTVKFQLHIAEAETLKDAPTPKHFSAEPRYEYFKRTAFTIDQWKQLIKKAKELHVKFLVSPFSLEAVDVLEELNISAYKIASGEVTNLPLLEKIASTKKPIILSSGMSNWNELDQAVNILKTSPLTIMQCTSAYPCPPEKVGLNIISEMKSRYNLPIGYSDHTMGIAAAVAAATLGASMIEKHFTFSRLMYGSDAKYATEPEEFKQFTEELHNVWKMLESPVDKSNVNEFTDMKDIYEKSIVTACPVSKGTVLKQEHLAYKKPGNGIPAKEYQSILGRIIKNDLPKDHMLLNEDLQ